jgi:hypothetical protein
VANRGPQERSRTTISLSRRYSHWTRPSKHRRLSRGGGGLGRARRRRIGTDWALGRVWFKKSHANRILTCSKLALTSLTTFGSLIFLILILIEIFKFWKSCLIRANKSVRVVWVGSRLSLGWLGTLLWSLLMERGSLAELSLTAGYGWFFLKSENFWDIRLTATNWFKIKNQKLYKRKL